MKLYARHTVELCVGKGTLCLSGTFNLSAKRSIIAPKFNKQFVEKVRLEAAGVVCPTSRR